ncbi:MAG TPA: SH3 domain-containing protein, partial [Anaerolineales bacterium]|nr:SH3 domain-containing protein [Anaerolineales bacterium]
LEVKPGCGCTVTKFDKVIAPGSEGNIYASVDVAHLKGPVKKSVFIKTNDPARPNATIDIKANIKTLVDIQPQEQIAIVVNKGAKASEQLFLTPDPSVKLLAPVVISNLISAKLTPDKNGSHRLTVDVTNSEIIGTHATEIKIPAQGAMKEVIVPVVINVRGPLEVSPRIVSFMLKGHPEEVLISSALDARQAPDQSASVVEKISAGKKLRVLNESAGWYQVITMQKSATRDAEPEQRLGWIPVSAAKTTRPPGPPDPQDVLIRIAKGKTFHVLGLRSTLPSVKVEKKAVGSQTDRYQLSVTLAQIDRKKKGTTRGEILVNTDNADQPEVRIPVFINVM